jgi:hypothetical protein
MHIRQRSLPGTGRTPVCVGECGSNLCICNASIDSSSGNSGLDPSVLHFVLAQDRTFVESSNDTTGPTGHKGHSKSKAQITDGPRTPVVTSGKFS